MCPLYEEEKKAIAEKAVKELIEKVDSDPNVIGVGLGERHTKTSDNKCKKYVVKIYVPWRVKLFGWLIGRSFPKFLPVVYPEGSKMVVNVPTQVEIAGKLKITAA